MEIREIIKESHRIAKEKGFWGKERNKLECIMLIVSELSEALEAHRSRNIIDIDSIGMYNAMKPDIFNDVIKDTFGDELADTFIRICDFSEGFNNTLESKDEIIKQYNHYSSEQYNKIKGIRKSENVGERLFEITSTICSIPAFEKSVAKGYIEGCCLGLIHRLAIDNKINLILHIAAKLNFNKQRDYLHGKKY